MKILKMFFRFLLFIYFITIVFVPVSLFIFLLSKLFTPDQFDDGNDSIISFIKQLFMNTIRGE